jgi:hypothetical protein
MGWRKIARRNLGGATLQTIEFQLQGTPPSPVHKGDVVETVLQFKSRPAKTDRRYNEGQRFRFVGIMGNGSFTNDFGLSRQIPTGGAHHHSQKDPG